VVAAFVADSAGCSPMNPHFVNLSTGASSYLWTFGNGGGSVSTNPAHSYTHSGLSDTLFHPILIATSAFGCTDTATAAVRVHPAPIAQFTANPGTACAPALLSFQDLTIGAVSMLWQYGDGTFEQTTPGNVSHSFTNGGSSPVQLPVRLTATTAFGCTDTTTVPDTNYPAIQATFELPAEVCSPATLQLTHESIGASQDMCDMGDGVALVGTVVTHTYVNAGQTAITRTVTLTVTSAYGCARSVQHDIVIHPTPNASFLATPFGQVFPDATVTINNTTATGPWAYAWSMGDGSSSTLEDPPAHTYATWGSYTIVLTVSTGSCTDTVSQQVIIDPPLPTASFIGVGEGCAPLTVVFTNTSLLALGYQWQFGDGATSIAEHPVHAYHTPGTYTVTLTAFGMNGGMNTMVKVDSVVVHPSALAFFSLQPSEVVAPTQPLFTYNHSTNATSYVWDFGDGSFSNEVNPVHYYQQPGTFDVSLIANNMWNCPDT